MSSNNNNIVDSISNTVSDIASSAGNQLNQAANYLSGRTEEAQKEAGKEAVKSDQTTIGQKIDGAKAYVEHGTNQAKADAKKNYYENKEEAESKTR